MLHYLSSRLAKPSSLRYLSARETADDLYLVGLLHALEGHDENQDDLFCSTQKVKLDRNPLGQSVRGILVDLFPLAGHGGRELFTHGPLSQRATHIILIRGLFVIGEPIPVNQVPPTDGEVVVGKRDSLFVREPVSKSGNLHRSSSAYLLAKKTNWLPVPVWD